MEDSKTNTKQQPRDDWPESTQLVRALEERWRPGFPERAITIALPSHDKRDEVEAAIVALGQDEAFTTCLDDTRKAHTSGRLTEPPGSLGFYAARLIAGAAKKRASAPMQVATAPRDETQGVSQGSVESPEPTDNPFGEEIPF